MNGLDEYVRDVCRVGQGSACCRFLSMGLQGFDCLKLSSMRGEFDWRASGGHMAARGDNCAGVVGAPRKPS